MDLVGEAPRHSGNYKEIFFEFVIQGKDLTEVRNMQRAYFNGKTLVEPTAFVASQAKLKHIIHENKK